MSQIVKAKGVKILNLQLAKEIALENGFSYSQNQRISGIGNANVEHKFTHTSGKNFGLNTNNEVLELLCDTDYSKFIHRNFTSKYSAENFQRKIELKGDSYQITTNTEDELIYEVTRNS